jgi:flagellar basal-body rod modification protein FlgD
MTEVNPVSNVLSDLYAADSKVSNSGSEIDQEGFLALLVAELQNQDPMEPLSNQEYVSQLTSFSSLGELEKINSSMEGLDSLADISDLLKVSLALQQTGINSSAVGLIGKEVEVASGTIQLGGSNDADISFNLSDTNAEEVTITLKTPSGTTIKEVTFNPAEPPAGIDVTGDKVTVDVKTFLDGNDYSGTASISVTASDGTDTSSVDTYIIGLVDGLDFTEDATMLTVDGTSVDIANVIAVNNPS